MMPVAPGLDSSARAGLLVDTNLLVLLAVGTVNRSRIETFKRTRQYTQNDFDLLVRVLNNFGRLFTVAHVLAEVSNLTDLPGGERLQARLVLKATISLLHEADMTRLERQKTFYIETSGLWMQRLGRWHALTIAR